MSRVGVLVAVIALGAAVAACGGSSGEEAPSSGSCLVEAQRTCLEFSFKLVDAIRTMCTDRYMGVYSPDSCSAADRIGRCVYAFSATAGGVAFTVVAAAYSGYPGDPAADCAAGNQPTQGVTTLWRPD